MDKKPLVHIFFAQETINQLPHIRGTANSWLLSMSRDVGSETAKYTLIFVEHVSNKDIL
jgi:hypothetical protein